MIDEKVLLADIDSVLGVMESPEIDYMKGYSDALLAVRGMIEELTKNC